MAARDSRRYGSGSLLITIRADGTRAYGRWRFGRARYQSGYRVRPDLTSPARRWCLGRPRACSAAPRRRAYGCSIVSRVVLDLHGARARKGVDIDALEAFLAHFRSALREYARAGEGATARKGGRPFARETAAAAFSRG